MPDEREDAPELQRAEIRVGVDDGEIRGQDQRALQAALDYVADLGGGTVRIGAGRFAMRNALRLRTGVRLVGVPGKTILAACDGAASPLACDGDCHQRAITLADPSGFRIGDGVSIQDDQKGGFAVTTATLIARLAGDAHTFRLSHALYLDYLVAQNASARRAFPIVAGWGVKDAGVEGISIEGNRERAEALNGCRGGGIYLFECERIEIRHCAVRHYPGDGISFQLSHDVTVEDCICEHNAELGLHPGSGSQRPLLRGNRSAGNGSDGLFVCWRVKHGTFEKNELVDNRGHGISIGHKDTDNLFRENIVKRNAKAGLLFRDEAEAMGAHRNVFLKNEILDNGAPEGNDEAASAAVLVRGHTHELLFRKNIIGNSKPGSGPPTAIHQGAHVRNLTCEENEFRNVKTQVERRAEA